MFYFGDVALLTAQTTCSDHVHVHTVAGQRNNFLH